MIVEFNAERVYWGAIKHQNWVVNGETERNVIYELNASVFCGKS